MVNFGHKYGDNILKKQKAKIAKRAKMSKINQEKIGMGIQGMEFAPIEKPAKKSAKKSVKKHAKKPAKKSVKKKPDSIPLPLPTKISDITEFSNNILPVQDSKIKNKSSSSFSTNYFAARFSPNPKFVRLLTRSASAYKPLKTRKRSLRTF